MPKATKFGAFAGVFTPSILTILGVIMYLRLGWVVGQSGLIGAVGIILIAHIISITTGLSISSIATDKKIKVGGIYYMLSRSLGLPMGGAIGITIFVGTSLSIALYLIGFAENFLSIESIRTFLGLGTSITDIRIIGTAAILILVILAFISTSLALKSQYIILGAIALSLVSVAVGFATNINFAPEEVLLYPFAKALPLETVFAIFFPAVTGFTAGVAMSGDLKDSKNAIPRGTLWAIGTGLVVYLGLAIALAFFVNRETLLTDYNFLMKIAFWSPLVVAGIWGATLSSALGGILGAPRILQAIARDKIFPKFFGNGHGANNEPRNALLLTFLIAEAGILVGELDVIARIVSMFYIAAYGFINLAFALENWASTDFRPSFKIPKWIGIGGFIACFAVMFKLDTIAMLLAIFIMFAIYFLLTKKEMQVDFGDVWQSVWSSIVRSSLSKIARKGLEDRNWQPNIILFSGGTSTRPHLIEFGIQLVGRKGFLSNFDLIKNNGNNEVMPRHKQTDYPDSELITKGIFTRKHVCPDIYEGIKTIAGTYGFSGIEPNTVMMGWGRQSESPRKFLETVNHLKALDLNVLLMDYDKNAGFGDYNQIDIWWRTTEKNGNIALVLLKFLWLSNEWRNAKARIIIVNPVNEQREIIYRNTRSIIDNMRIQAEIKIINNQVEQRSFYDIVQVESVNSDLIFLGLPKISQGEEETFVEETNQLCKDIGTVVLLRASTNFKKHKIGIKKALLSQIDKLEEKVKGEEVLSVPISNIKYPEKEAVARQVKLLYGDLMEISRYMTNNFVLKLFGYHANLINLIEEAVDKSFSNIKEKVTSLEIENQQKSLIKFESNLLFRFRKIITDFEQEVFDIQQSKLKDSIDYFFQEIDKVIFTSPAKIEIPLNDDDLKPDKAGSFSNHVFILRHKIIRIFNKENQASYKLKYQPLIKGYLAISTNRLIYDWLDKWGISTLNHVIKGRALINRIALILFELEKATLKGITNEMIEQKREIIFKEIDQLRKYNNESSHSLSEFLIIQNNKTTTKVSSDLNCLNANKLLKEYNFGNQGAKSIRKFVLTVPKQWQRNQILLFNSIKLELGLLAFTTKLRTILNDVANEIDQTFNNHFISHEIKIRDQLLSFLKKLVEDNSVKFNPEALGDLEEREKIQAYFNQLIEKTFRKIKLATSVLPENIELMAEDSLNNFFSLQYKSIESIDISVSQLMDYILQSEFVEPLQKSVSQLPHKLEQLNTTVNEIVRNLTFSIEKESEKVKDGIPKSEQVVPIFEKQIKLLEIEINKSIDLKSQIQNLLNERLNTFEDRLSYHSFIKSATNLKQYMREIKSRKRWDFFRSQRNKTKQFAQHLLNQFWYRQSIGLMFTQRLIKEFTPGHFRVNDALNLTERVSIKREILQKLPFYYTQLFLRKQYYLNEFWVGRSKELGEAAKAIRRYEEGARGGILILGEYNSGKTFFSQYFIHKYYNNAEVFNLTPPHGGSIDVNLFKESIENTLESQGTYYRIFNTLPENSVLIIDDLALWWEKSSKGFDVIIQIIDIIEKYSHKCLFVINLNKCSFELMNRIHHIENYFINIINLEPFNSEELQQIVINRHKSSNFKLRMANNLREHLRPWDYARLFAKYFSYSKGNAGVVLSSWLVNISDVEKNIISVAQPRIPDLSILDQLKPDWYLLIVQIILHKRANLRKLSRICMESIKEIKIKIDILKRSGIIIEPQTGIYEINGFLYPHIQSKLIEKEML